MKKLFKRFLIYFTAFAGIFVFMVAPRTGSKADMSAFTGAFAHRGYFNNESGIPENSLAAFQKAVDAGVGIELDVQLSSDGVAMVFHDKTLERMCGVEGNVWDYTSQELQQMTLLGTEYTIPTLQQAVELIAGQVPVIVEHKMDLVDTAICQSSYNVMKDYQGNWCMKSFDPRALIWYKSNAPEVIRGQLSAQFWEDEQYSGKPLYVAMGYMVANVLSRPDFISYYYEHKDNISLKICRLLGAQTACWTIQSQMDFDSLKDEFDIVLFDNFELTI